MARGLRIRPRSHANTMPLSRDRLLFFTLLLTTFLVVALCIAIAVPFVPALTWAVVFAILASPLHTWIQRRLSNKNIAALLAVVLVAIVIIAPVAWISIQITQEAVEGAKQAQAGIKSGAWEIALHRHPAFVRVYTWLNARVDLGSAGMDVANAVQAQLAKLLGGTIGAIVQGAIALFALFFFFRDRAQILGAIRLRLPLSDVEISRLLRQLKNMVRATVYGKMLTSLIQGALGGLMFWVLGIPAALLWSIAMALLSLVPTFGAFLIWGPAAVWLAVSGSWVKATILAGWGIGVVGTIDNVLYPLLVGRDVRIHSLLLFIALLGGVLLFGASGLVLGPVVIETGLTLIDILRERTRADHSMKQEA
jgi:predicted PurR-regulated permease PerM